MEEGSETAFELILDTANERGLERISTELLRRFLFETGSIFNADDLSSTHVYSLRKKVRVFCASMELPALIHNLDCFAENIKCTCDLKTNYRCECRSGVSNVAAILLDAYLEKTVGPHSPETLWKWLRPLDFSKRTPPVDCAAASFFSKNPLLRQRIHQLAFDELTEAEAIWEMSSNLKGMGRTKAHPSIQFHAGDWQPIIDHAFVNDRTDLWNNFVSGHYNKRNNFGVDEGRSQARKQANEKPEFMRVWARKEANWRKVRDKYPLSLSRINRRRKKRQEAVKRHNDQFLLENEKQIRAGQHWGWLEGFAIDFLQRGYEGEESYTNNDPTIAKDALINCFDFLEKETPTLRQLAKLRIESKSSRFQTVLLAACAVTLEIKGTLSTVPKSALRAVMAHFDMHYSGYGGDEKTALEAEVTKCLFESDNDVEEFAREFIEPQLLCGAEHTNVGWLEYKEPFQPVSEELAFEWLDCFPMASLDSQNTLFRIAARSKERRQELIELITLRSAQNLFMLPMEFEIDAFDEHRKFWLMRYFYFVEEMYPEVFDALTVEKNSIFAFDQISGILGRDDNQDFPELSAQKIYAILDAYVDRWPKVFLPNSYGTGSPSEQVAYRFLTDQIWRFTSTDPTESLSIIDQVLNDTRFEDFRNSAKNVRSRLSRQLALRDFEPPKAQDLADFFVGRAVLSVEQLRTLLLEELDGLQSLLRGAETDPVNMFYNGDKRVDENTARDRIVDLLRPRLEAKNLGISIERHMADSKRCDITLEKSFGGRRSLLVIEVKGQWHSELYTAASAQLHERYSIHPDAAEQGIYLVLWFGGDELIAGCKATLATPAALKNSLEVNLPPEIESHVDVAILDLAKTDQ